MKILLTGLLSLIFLSSYAQRFSVQGEIDRAGRQMINRHAAASPDTCLPKAEIKAAKLYVDDLEDRFSKSLQDIALMKFQIEQRGERIGALESTNQRLESDNAGLQTTVNDCQSNQKIGNWVSAGLGAAVGAVIMLLIGN